MERPFEFNGIKVKTPNTFKPQLATTSTEDSDRVQKKLTMNNTPLGTIESYSFEWRYIEPEEATKIVKQIKDKAKYSLRYLSASAGKWKTDEFYTTNYDFGTLTIANGKFVWEYLSFNAISITAL